MPGSRSYVLHPGAVPASPAHTSSTPPTAQERCRLRRLIRPPPRPPPKCGAGFAGSCWFALDDGGLAAEECRHDPRRQLATGVRRVAAAARAERRVDGPARVRVNEHEVRGSARMQRLTLAAEPADAGGT